jgi:hypothetical protein
MKLSAFAIIKAMLCSGYGLSLLIFPAKFLEPYGIILNDQGVLMARGYGSALCQIAIIYWFNRNIPGSERSWRILLPASLLYDVVMTAVQIIAITNGVVNVFAWTTVIFQVTLAAFCIYFLFRLRKK